MPMTPAEVERKVRQLDHDVQSIYELLMTIQSTQTRHTNRLHELGEDVGSLGTRVDNLDTKVDALDTKVDNLDTKVDALDTKVDALDTKVDALGTQMGEVLELLRAR
jgi:outer membrane murein-binding lipoprotein Lpp